MLRKHPDAVALTVLGFVLLVASIPRLIVRQAEWSVQPLKIEVPHDQIRAERDRIREEVRRELRNSRDEIRSAIDEVKSAIRH